MIAKIKTRADFGGIVNYANDQKNKKKCATLIAHEGVCAVSNKAISDSFQIQASMRPKVKSLVKHVSLAFSSQDISRFPDNEEGDALMVEIAKKWMEQMGIRNTQYIIARHHDTKHPHCHLVFNRIDNDGNLISDSNERIRNAKVCRALTKEYGLYFAPKNSKARNTVTRALVTQTNTTVSVTGGVGYIDCDSFGTQTGTYFQEGVRGNDSAVHAWIVDLRGNGGGLTSAAVSALGAFSGEGDLIYFVDQDGESTAQSYLGKDLTDKPAIVLMDSGSASASEIFAGGVLGTGSGIVIGTRSYGKGVAQVLYDESNCPYLHGDAVKVTAYRFYCAGGNTPMME